MREVVGSDALGSCDVCIRDGVSAARLVAQTVKCVIGIGEGIPGGGVVFHQAGDIFIGDAVGLGSVTDDVSGAFGSAQLVVGVLHLQDSGTGGGVLLPCKDEACGARTGRLSPVLSRFIASCRESI